MAPPSGRTIPDATVARLPIYQRVLGELQDRGAATVSSEDLAELSGVNAAKVRKDLSFLGSYGIRGVGYEVDYLLFQIRNALGLTQQWPVVIVGVGNLGRALADYAGFTSRGFPVAALVDDDPAKVGTEHVGIVIRALSELRDVVRDLDVAIGVIAIPASGAQRVADLLVEAGVSSILNFAPTVLSVPDGVNLRQVDLAVELQILSFHRRHRNRERGAVDPAAESNPRR
ncbi:MAG: redox-sensing transcriptional repressor Rex [Actinobacteria bacterium]|nr:redox-sensing transcriptional repressor Rex [Actinomycetota bacterium]